MKELPPEFLAEISAVQRQMTDALGVVAQWQRQFETLRPLIQLPAIENILPAYNAIIPDFAAAFADALKPLASLQPYLTRMTIGMAQSRELAEAGWLPHATLPMDMVNENLGNPEKLSDTIERYYRESWSLIREKLIARVHSYQIDDEAKAAFQELLEGHGHSLYRLVCRSVFPEIERVARAELHDNDFSTRITSQKDLRELAGETPIDEIDPLGFFGLEFFKKLTEHSYVQVENEPARERMRMDAVPNRHAALHGIVTYNSFKNSLNAIFLADYVFQVIHAFKQAQVRS